MFLERWFRLSGYLTLGLSCGALVFAEAPFLPDLQICLAPVLALLLLGWWVEGHWSLPNRGADLLGLLIVAAGAFWLLKHRSDEDFVLTQLPLHLAMLPYMGPLLIAALLVKVFRAREAGDFWHLQGLGLLLIGLGCVLDGGPAFGAAMAAYLASALACLVLHYRLTAHSMAKDYPNLDRKAAVEPAPTPLLYGRGSSSQAPRATNWWLLSFTLRWMLLIALPALLLFLLTPRRDNGAWEPLNNFRSGFNRVRVRGGSEEVNLNNTGRLELDDEVALQVVAVDSDGQPKLDLPFDQRWRSTVLDYYENGTWTMLHLGPENSRPIRQGELPNFGRDQFFLTFTVQPRRAGGLVVAEPIRFGSVFARLPVLSLADGGRERLFAEQWGTLLPVEIREKRREYRYRQVVSARGDPSRTTASASPTEMSKAIQLLTGLPPPLRTTLQSWTADLLLRLSRQPRYQVPRGVRATLEKSPVNFVVGPNEWEATALLLADYLAHSGEFTYTLEITRQDRSIDPVLDFLVNLKQGHCERYAAALASILRSVDIPARIVKGFRGWGSKGDGLYLVRHRHAHAWVEILMPRRRLPDRMHLWPGQDFSFDWLTLDPTPPTSVPAAPVLSLSNMWQQVQQFCIQGWRSLIVEYSGEEQADLWEALTSDRPLPVLSKLGLVALAAASVVVLWLFLRRLRQRRRTANIRGNGGDATIYARLALVLGRYASLRPDIGQTPREYGESARDVLQARPAVASLAGWPMRVIELFYRVRFGGRALQEDESQTLEREFNHFVEALRQPDELTEPRP